VTKRQATVITNFNDDDGDEKNHCSDEKLNQNVTYISMYIYAYKPLTIRSYVKTVDPSSVVKGYLSYIVAHIR